MFKKGHKHSEATKRKIALANKGKSLFTKGYIPWNKGKKNPKVSGKKSNFWKGNKIERICLTCGKKFETYPSLDCRYCSRLCFNKTKIGIKQSTEMIEKRIQRGEKHYNWRGGISKEPYGQGWTKTLKEAIRQRDQYKCQACGAPQEECIEALSVHHRDDIKNNLDLENLISLCRSCHMKVHRNTVKL